MADGNQAPATHPLANMINEAKAGNIKVRMDLDQFVYLDRDCQTLLDNIALIKNRADAISRQAHWGLGEGFHDGDKELISGQKVVEWYRQKGRAENDNTDNSLYAIMVAHEQIVRDIQQTYQEIRKQITDHDTEQAAKYNQLMSSLPQQSPVQSNTFHATNLPPKK